MTIVIYIQTYHDWAIESRWTNDRVRSRIFAVISYGTIFDRVASLRTIDPVKNVSVTIVSRILLKLSAAISLIEVCNVL
jgi:hypothetical protein